MHVDARRIDGMKVAGFILAIVLVVFVVLVILQVAGTSGYNPVASVARLFTQPGDPAPVVVADS